MLEQKKYYVEIHVYEIENRVIHNELYDKSDINRKNKNEAHMGCFRAGYSPFQPMLIGEYAPDVFIEVDSKEEAKDIVDKLNSAYGLDKAGACGVNYGYRVSMEILKATGKKTYGHAA